MINAINDIFLAHVRHRLVNERLVVILDEAHQLLRPQRLEPLLDLGEHQFYWIILGTICWAEDVPEAKLLHIILGLVRPVDGQVVHQQTNFVIAIGRPHGVQPLLKLGRVDRLREDHIMLLAFFF